MATPDDDTAASTPAEEPLHIAPLPPETPPIAELNELFAHPEAINLPRSDFIDPDFIDDIATVPEGSLAASPDELELEDVSPENLPLEDRGA